MRTHDNPHRIGQGPRWARALAASLAALSLWILAGCSSVASYRAEPTEAAPDPWQVLVTFEGFDSINEIRLRRLVEDYLKELSRLPDRAATMIDAEFDLTDLYRQEGFADAVVSHRIERDEEARTLTVHLHVNEGPLVTTSMEIVGAKAFEIDTLRELWVRRASGALGLGDPLFVETDVRAFRDSLLIHYRTRGYRDAQVGLPEIDRAPGSTKASVRIEIDEGDAWHLAQISISQSLVDALPTETRATIDAKIGQVAAAGTLEEIRYTIVGALRRIGYPHPTAKLEPSAAADTAHAVHLEVTGEPGRRGRVTDITISGNERTSTWFIRGFAEIELDSWYHGPSIDLLRRDLYLTGLFQSVDVEEVWLDDSTMRLVIKVTETESKSVDFLTGYGSYERIRGMVRFEERDVFGTGRRFSVEGRASQRGYRTAATITDPRFLGTRNEFTIGADLFRREEPAFTDRARGVTAAISRDLGHGFKARTGYTFRRRSDSTSELADDLDNYTQGNAFVELKLEQRDSVLYPRSGYSLDWSYDRDDPGIGSDVEFERVRFSATGYVPIYRNIHVALRAATGAIFPGEGSDRIPIQERFFNGGEGTVRSFRESRLGPLDGMGSPVGGEFRNVFTVELRAPIRGLLEAALFADAGNVGTDVGEYGLDDMRYAIGAGLRLQLPIGPIRVDSAWNPDRDPGEDEWVIHLSVGYPF